LTLLEDLQSRTCRLIESGGLIISHHGTVQQKERKERKEVHDKQNNQDITLARPSLQVVIKGDQSDAMCVKKRTDYLPSHSPPGPGLTNRKTLLSCENSKIFGLFYCSRL